MTSLSPVKESLPSLLSSSPADLGGRKRTRSALKALNINGGSPEKVDANKPVRKASRASVSSVRSSNKENVVDEFVDQQALENHENMVLDA